MKHTSKYALAPVQPILIAGIVYVLLFAFSAGFYLTQPTVAVSQPEQLSTDLDDFVRGHLQQQNAKHSLTLLCDGFATDTPLVLTNLSLIEDPEELASFKQKQDFFNDHSALYQCLHADHSRAVLKVGDSGEVLSLIVGKPSNIFDLPVGFYLVHLLGLLTLLFGIGVWSGKRSSLPNRLILIWSLCVVLVVHSMSVYAFRTMIVEPAAFELAHKINRVAVQVMAFSILSLMSVYPTRLVSNKVLYVFVLLACLVIGNEAIEVLDWPLHTHYLPLVLIYLIAIVAIIVQWRKSSATPIQRAAIYWFLLSIVVCNGLAIALYVLPVMLSYAPFTPLWIGQSFILCMFFGFALGVAKYKLFAIEIWWLKVWFWCLIGLSVFILDLVLVYALNLAPEGALGLSLLVVAWFYLPFRDTLWNRFFKSNQHPIETHLPPLISALISSPSAAHFEKNWPNFLATIFSALSVRVIDKPVCSSTAPGNDGYSLRVETLFSQQLVQINGKAKGLKLFTRQDIDMANNLLSLSRIALDFKKASEQHIATERSRIMRDLHDDVGAKLLALFHMATDTQQRDLAKQSLAALKQVVYTLDEVRKHITLSAAVATWQNEINERAKIAQFDVRWEIDVVADSDALMGFRCWLNVSSILREGFTNALKYSSDNTAEFKLMYKPHYLEVKISNQFKRGAANLDSSSPEHHGAGMAIMQKRSEEIGAGFVCQQLGETHVISVQCALSHDTAFN